jgi:hypothetical protein
LSYINDHRNDASSGGRRCRVLLQANEEKLEQMGVKNVSIPNRQTRSEQRRSTRKTILRSGNGAPGAKAGSAF